MAVRVDIVSDVVCPWCIIGYLQLAKGSAQSGIAIEVFWHPFELNPDMPAEGQNLRAHLAAKYGITAEASQKARDHLTSLGAALDFRFDYAEDMRMVNTFRAHQLIHAASKQGKAHQTKMALFEAFFTRRADLNDIAVLTAVAKQVGLAPDATRADLESEVHAGDVRSMQSFWTSRGITGVPAMVFDRQHLVTGAQGEETYARILAHLTQAETASDPAA